MTKLTFYFDPRCPLAWRTSLWVRDLERRGLITIDWKLFSLAEINRDPIQPISGPITADAALRALWLARREGGREAIDRLYLALGRARHDRHQDLDSHEMLREALESAELDRALLDRALADPAVNTAVLAEHQDSVDRLGAFGVPWLVVDDLRFGFYGPIISQVPEEQEALDLWEHTSWMLQRPYLYELKRPR